MADPGRADLWPSLTWNVDRVRFISQHTKKADYPVVAASELWLNFNLARPFEASVKRNKSVFERFQELFRSQYPELVIGNKRDRFDKYRTYLQLLDAEEAGASHDEMAAALFPGTLDGKDNVRKALARARELRDGGYLDLLL
jgi:hypothetical protein